MTDVLLRYLEEHRRLLTGLLAVLVANVLFSVLFTGPARIRAARFETELAKRETDRDKALREYGQALLESRLLESSHRQIGELYTGTFQTETERFPIVDTKIKEIANRFRLEPRSYTYGYVVRPREKLEQLSVAFNLKGSYESLRQFIAEVEQARDASGKDLFFSIDRVNLTDSTETGSELNLTISVTTYFHRPELPDADGKVPRATSLARPERAG